MSPIGFGFCWICGAPTLPPGKADFTFCREGHFQIAKKQKSGPFAKLRAKVKNGRK